MHSLTGIIFLIEVTDFIRFYLFLIVGGAWLLMRIHKMKRKQSLLKSGSLREKIRKGEFSLTDIPLISYTIMERTYNQENISFSSASRSLMPGLMLGTADLPYELLQHIPVDQDKSILVFNASYEDPDVMATGDKQKFVLEKSVYIEFSYDAGSAKYIFRTTFYEDNPEKSLFRKIAFLLEEYILTGKSVSFIPKSG